MVYCWLSLTGHGHWGRQIAPCGRRSDRLGPAIVHDAEGQHARREETRKTRKRSARGDCHGELGNLGKCYLGNLGMFGDQYDMWF